MNPITFPFEVPSDYRNYFLLEIEGFKTFISVEGNEIRMGQRGDCPPELEGNVLDWIEDSLMSVRKELGK